VRFDFYSDQGGSEAVPIKKESCEMRGDGVETLGCGASRHNKLVPRNSALHMSPMG